MLVVLEVVVGSEVGRQIKIPQDRTCKVGRTNYSDEAFTDDVMMSGQHFEIRNDGKYCWLRDLESRNGTRVDDDFVKESLVIRDGQKVFAGRTEFMVKIEGGAKNPYESTSIGVPEPVRNRSLMSTTFGSKVYAEDDPRFPKSEPDPHGHGKPAPPGAPSGPPIPPVAPAPPSAGVPQQPPGGNLEFPSTAETPNKFPPSGSFSPPEFGMPDSGTAPGTPPGFPPVGNPPPPGPSSHGTSKSPPWAHPSPTPVTPGQPMPGQVAPGQLPPGTPTTSQPEFTPPHKRGGDDGPVFKFAKGGGDAGPVGPPPGMPPSFRHTPGTPPGSPPGSPPPVDPRFQSPPPHAEPPSVTGAPPSFEPPGQPPLETPSSFAPPPARPLPPGTPQGPPGTPPAGFPNFDEPDTPPQFTNFAPPPPSQDPEPPEGKFGPPGSQSPPPWEAQGGFGDGKNPNLDFGSDDFGPNTGPALDFGDEGDDEDEPLFGPPSFAGGSGPSFTNQMGPSGGNPNLVGFSPDEPPANKFTGPPSEDEPLPSSGSPANMIEPMPPAPGSNWRNPDFVSAAPPPSQIDNSESKAAASPDSVRGLCFKEETADSGYPVYHSIIEGVPEVPFSPFALISELSRVAKPVLSIHFMRAEMPIPEDLVGTPLRGDLDAKFAALGGPMLYCPDDLEPFRKIIEELWGLDAISCLFTSGDPQGVVDHFRQGLFAPKRGDLPTPGPGPQFFAVFSPNLLTTFLSQRDQETVDHLLGDEIVGVLAEVADMPDSWQLFTKKSWAEPLKKLGMNRVVEQPQ